MTETGIGSTKPDRRSRPRYLNSRRWAKLLPLILGALAVVGCQASDSDSPESRSDGLEVARSSGGISGTGDGALLTGKLIDHNGCLAVESGEPQYIAIPVFDVKDSRATTLEVGTEVDLGGGSMSAQDNFEIPEKCADATEYFLVNLE